MAKITFIKPLDQPLGTRRLLDDLKKALSDSRFQEFRLIVAYGKSGPLHRLREGLERWRGEGKKIEAIIGIDQHGTSREALSLALELFDSVYVTQESGITFHPKIYLFKGPKHAEAFVGSNNLTVGGTEKNFESALHIEMTLASPEDIAVLTGFEIAWNELLPGVCLATRFLDVSLLDRLVADGFVIDERAIRRSDGDSDSAAIGGGNRPARSGLLVKPESPLPKRVLASGVLGLPSKKIPGTFGKKSGHTVPAEPATARGLVIQIKPHHNGEIFLSVTAALQNPKFFKWPFNGKTKPKKTGNPSYPQIDPDPIVNVRVYGSGPTPVLTLTAYALNTVYYTKKSEIRITASPLVSVVPEYSVMIMERSESPGVDYDITIHRPDSPEYKGWVAACNQTMPGGGQKARRYGWF